MTMKRWLVVFLIGILSLFVQGEAKALDVAIDWWGLWGSGGAEFGEINSSLYGEGFVDGGALFTDPLFTNGQDSVVENAHYTWSADGFILTSAQEMFPDSGLWNIEYSGGTINFYEDMNPYTIGDLSEIQDWTNARTTSQFTDGTLVLTANFTTFNLFWNDVANMGQSYYEMNFTGGTWINKLAGTNGLGGTFISQIFIDPSLDPAYVVDSDGSIAVVPEPGSLLLLGSGLIGSLLVRRKKS